MAGLGSSSILLYAALLLLSMAGLSLSVQAFSDKGDGWGSGISEITIRVGEPLWRIDGGRYLIGGERFYLLLFEGDMVSLGVSHDLEVPWRLEVVVRDLGSGEEYVFNETFRALKAPTPLFIAPRAGFYEYYLRISADLGSYYEEGATVTVTRTWRLALEPGPRTGFFMRVSVLALAVVAVSLLLAYYSSRLVPGRRGLLLLSFEQSSATSWAFFGALAFIFSIIIDASSRVRSRESLILSPIAFSNNKEVFIVLIVIASVFSSLLFSYKRETGIERTIEALPVGRAYRFLVRLAVCFVTLYLPLVLVSLALYVAWMPGFIADNPGYFFRFYGMEMAHYLVLVFIALSLALPFAVLLPRLSFSIVPPLLAGTAIYYSPEPLLEAIPWLYLISPTARRNLLVLEDPYISETFNAGLLAGSALAFLLIALASLIVYSRRELA